MTTLVEQLYDANQESFADAAARGEADMLQGKPLPVGDCRHSSEMYYDETGFGPLCTHCGNVVYHGRAIQRHAKKEPLVRRLVYSVVLVPLAWSALVKDYLWRGTSPALDAFANALLVATAGWLGALHLVALTPGPVMWLDWVRLTAFTLVFTAVLAWWTQILPRQPLLSRRGWRVP